MLYVQLITSKLDNILIIKLFGIKSLYLKVEHLVLNVTLKLSSHISHKVIMILLTHQKKLSLYVLLKISLIKLSILSNGQDNISKALLQFPPVILENSMKINKITLTLL
jgi:hypothetical protein